MTIEMICNHLVNDSWSSLNYMIIWKRSRTSYNWVEQEEEKSSVS